MDTILTLLTDTFYLLYIITIIGTIVVVIMDNRNPVKTLAWILVLTFLPVLGLILYITFGQKRHKHHVIAKRSYKKITKKNLSYYSKIADTNVPKEYEGLTSLMKNMADAPLYAQNDIEVYDNGYDKIKSLLNAISQARHHIHIEYYIFANDSTGRIVKDALIDKAKEGVTVRIIIDDVGCWHLNKSFIEEMTKAGIQVVKFLKVQLPYLSSRINYRNHRKNVIIDGKTGFIGGMNIADRYVNGVKWGQWRDTHLKIEGIAVQGLQTSFLSDWYFVTKELITDKAYFPTVSPQGESLVQIVQSDPIDEWKEIMQGMIYAIMNAKNYVYIQTPYFLPTEPFINALQTASMSGVDVRVMIPEKSDTLLVQYASFSYIKDLLTAGIKVYFYKDGFLHAKTIISDDNFASVGSTNMDFRSFEQNFELNAFIYDKKTTLMLKEMFHKDMRHSRRILLKNWNKRPIYHKTKESFIRIFSPLL